MKNTAGIKKAIVSYSKETADITYDSEVLSLKDICGVIEKLGYRVQKNHRRTNADISKTILVLVFILAGCAKGDDSEKAETTEGRGRNTHYRLSK